jgi:hypothetical protein
MDPKFVLRQAFLWEKFAKLLPIIVLASSSIFYFLGFRNWDLLVDTFIVVGIIMSIVWWWWVVYTIILIAQVLDKSKIGLQDIMEEIKSVKEDIKDLRS